MTIVTRVGHRSVFSSIAIWVCLMLAGLLHYSGVIIAYLKVAGTSPENSLTMSWTSMWWKGQLNQHTLVLATLTMNQAATSSVACYGAVEPRIGRGSTQNSNGYTYVLGVPQSNRTSRNIMRPTPKLKVKNLIWRSINRFYPYLSL